MPELGASEVCAGNRMDTSACRWLAAPTPTIWRTSAGHWLTAGRSIEDVGSGASRNRTGLNRLKATLEPGDCVKVAALDRLGRSLSEVLELLNWLHERGASKSSVSGSPSIRTAPQGGRCCTWPLSSPRWSAT